ncbi:hypothetical protein GOODEAATRI_011958, partial [Goodea atripinnis]
RTDERAACSLWTSSPILSFFCTSMGAGSPGTLGSSSSSAPTGLHPASAQARVSVIIPASAKTFPCAPTPIPPCVSVQTAVFASANTLPSGQRFSSASGPAPGETSSTLALSLIVGVPVRIGGTVGSRGILLCFTDA